MLAIINIFCAINSLGSSPHCKSVGMEANGPTTNWLRRVITKCFMLLQEAWVFESKMLANMKKGLNQVIYL